MRFNVDFYREMSLIFFIQFFQDQASGLCSNSSLSINMKRRSRLEMKADILRSLEARDRKKTDIVCLQHMYSETVTELLEELKKSDLVSQNNKIYSIRPSGRELLRMLDMVEEKLK